MHHNLHPQLLSWISFPKKSTSSKYSVLRIFLTTQIQCPFCMGYSKPEAWMTSPRLLRVVSEIWSLMYRNILLLRMRSDPHRSPFLMKIANFELQTREFDSAKVNSRVNQLTKETLFFIQEKFKISKNFAAIYMKDYLFLFASP